jgi:hypothetical protein
MPMLSARAANETLLWIHKRQVVTVWSPVLWSDHLYLCLKNQSDKPMHDEGVGVGRLDILGYAGGK